jgi:hypothetical protein
MFTNKYQHTSVHIIVLGQCSLHHRVCLRQLVEIRFMFDKKTYREKAQLMNARIILVIKYIKRLFLCI